MSLQKSISLSELASKARSGFRLLHNDVRARYGERYPVKPRTLNLLVNDICNAECEMCNIWQREPEEELTPAELAEILSDPLFDELDYIGVSGGEPTLRPDLPGMYEAIIESCPGINGTGIITNGLVSDVVIDRIEQSGEVVRDAGIDFNVMVSLDGVGEVHDRVRGTDGAFENSIEVMRHFRDETDFDTSIGCTITSDNVYHVDDLYEFCKEENVDYKFRVAEFIDRLYNDKERNEQYIRNFSEREAYHLGLFFAKLEAEAKFYGAHNRTYRNIRKMLLEGADRSIGCYMQSTGATLDSRGELAYCAPKSPKLGDCRERSAAKLYRENLDVRDEIREDHCDDCIHDYPSPKIATELAYLPRRTYWKKRLSLDVVLAETKGKRLLPGKNQATVSGEPEPDSVLILGWYGTETAGDKAILGQVIHDVKKRNPNADVTLASLNPYLSEWTVQELDYPNVEVVNTYSRRFLQEAAASDEVIMGGGPLMHIGALGVVLKAFRTAKQAGNRTHIAGCGIGPLDKGEKYREAVRYILELSDDIKLRNAGAVDAARELVDRTDIQNSGDPAFEFVHRWKKDREPPDRQPFLNLYLRDWPRDYGQNLSDEEFEELKAEFETELGAWIEQLCEHYSLQPRLLPMHHFFIGNDDRVFARNFAADHLEPRGLDPIVERRPLTVHEILESMREGELSLCMRYHSVAFANELGEDFLAIDYSQGGKVARYLEERELADKARNVTEIANGERADIGRE